MTDITNVTWIAEEPLVFLAPDGRRIPGRIAVGLPRMVVEDGAEHAWCDLALEPLLRGVRHTLGESPLQALVAALRLIGSQLDDFLGQGWRVLEPGTEGPDVDFAIAAILGPLLGPRDPPSPPES